MKHWRIVLSFLLLISLVLVACGDSDDDKSTSNGNGDVQTKYTGKVLWVDSYHEGYAWSDGIESGIRSVLGDTGVELKVFHMDTKNNPDNAEEAATQAKAEIDTFQPDVVIASDDNAQSFVIVPYLLGTDTPVVFSGVNWTAEGYGYPAENVTGMIEVDPIEQALNLLKDYAEGERVGFISIDNETEQKIVKTYNERFFDGEMKVYLLDSFSDLKAEFLRVQAEDEVDILFFNNYAGAADWDPDEAEAFFRENTQIPTGGVNDWMAPYVLIVAGKVAPEQGQWAAETALQILDGTAVSDIPVAENNQANVFINLDIAANLEIAFPPDLLRNATTIGGSNGEEN